MTSFLPHIRRCFWHVSCLRGAPTFSQTPHHYWKYASTPPPHPVDDAIFENFLALDPQPLLEIREYTPSRRWDLVRKYAKNTKKYVETYRKYVVLEAKRAKHWISYFLHIQKNSKFLPRLWDLEKIINSVIPVLDPAIKTCFISRLAF